jgi:hypothetical protein
MSMVEDNESNGTTTAINSQNSPHANFSKTMKLFEVGIWCVIILKLTLAVQSPVVRLIYHLQLRVGKQIQ